jgi:hypothetical protein
MSSYLRIEVLLLFLNSHIFVTSSKEFAFTKNDDGYLVDSDDSEEGSLTNGPVNINISIVDAERKTNMQNQQHNTKNDYKYSRRTNANTNSRVPLRMTNDKRIGVCNKDIMQAFGLFGKNNKFTIFEASPMERHFCIKNKLSCCDANSYLRLQKWFGKNSEALKLSLEPMLELLTLFQGKKFSHVLRELRLNDKCQSSIKASGRYEMKTDFFENKNIEFSIEIIRKYALEFHVYVKTVLGFYGSLICSLCNPYQTKYIRLSKKNPVISVDMNTVQRRIEIIKYEIGFSQIFQSFIHPLAKLVQCHFELETDPEFYLQTVDFFETDVKVAIMKKCLDDFTAQNPVCQSLMRVKLVKHSFHIELSTQINQSLNLLYFAVTGRRISDYYKSMKKTEWEESPDSHHLFFDKSNEVFTRLKFSKTFFKVEDDGINVYGNTMSENFYIVEFAFVIWLNLKVWIIYIFMTD